MPSHSTLKSFIHTLASWILQGENYLFVENLGINLHDYVDRQKSQGGLDLEAYDCLQAVLVMHRDESLLMVLY